MAVSLPDADETALNASALAGDEDALAHLLTLHRPLAYNVAYRLLGREADASDAVQEASLLALRAVRGEGAPPREVDRFKPWLLRIVINAALGELRRRPNGSQVPLDAVSEALPGSDRAEPARELERREARGDVLRALLVLPDTQRVALTLREFQELSYDEIADVLGVGRPAVAQLLFRARRNFRAAYEGLAETNGAIGCPELAPLVSAVLDGEVAESAWPKLQAHLGGCRRCRRELNGLRQTRRLHALIPVLAPPIGLCWTATATANAAGLAAVVTASPAVIAPAVITPAVVAPAVVAPLAATTAAPIALGGGLLAKVAGVAAAKVAAPVIAAGLSVAVVAAPAPAFDPTDAAPAIELPSAAAESVTARSASGRDGSIPVAPSWVIELPALAEAPPAPPEPEAAPERVSRKPSPPADAMELARAVVLADPQPELPSPASPSAATDTTQPAQPSSADLDSPTSAGLGEPIDLAPPAPALVAALQPDADAKDQTALRPVEADPPDSSAVQRVQRSMVAQSRQDQAALADRREVAAAEQPATPPMPTPRATSSPPSPPSGQPLAIAAMATPTVAPTPPSAVTVNPTAPPPTPSPPTATPPTATPPTVTPPTATSPPGTPPATATQPPVPTATQPPAATPMEQPPTSGTPVSVDPTPRATATGPTPMPLADDPPERKLAAAFAQQPTVELGRESPPSRRRTTDVVEASGEVQPRAPGSERLTEAELESQPPLQSSTVSTQEPDPVSKHEAEPTSRREQEPASKRVPELAPKLEPELAPDLKPADDDKEQRKLKDKGQEKEPPKLEAQQSSKAKCKKGQKRSNGKCKSKSPK